ncbi:MAG: NAD/NADP octopine/nopaline dehydrogenase family protein [Candidatus Margulisiibacteriota bacterium]
MPKVTVLGAGNAGQTHAFHLTTKGHEICLYEHPDFAKALDSIKQNGNAIEAVAEFKKGDLTIKSALSGTAKVAKVTTDIKEALDWSDIIIMPVPAFAQANMFKQMMPHLRDGHLFTILPGNEASLIFAKMLREAGIKKNVTFCEAASIPYACRIVGPAKIFIGGMKDAFEFGVFPANRTAAAVKTMKAIMPLELDVKQNVIEVHFYNLNIIAHPVTATLNMGAFESRKGEFFFYKEGMSPSVSKVQQKVDDERIAIGAKFGFQLDSFISLIKLWYHIDAKDIHDFSQITPIHNAFGYDAPKSPQERYIAEDTPYILVTMHEYAGLAGVADPAIRSIIDIDNIYNDTDYFLHGRTLVSLGLAGMTIKEILEYAKTGELKVGKAAAKTAQPSKELRP